MPYGPIIGLAQFTASDGTSFAAYAADVGLGLGTNPSGADPAAYRISSNRLIRPDNVNAGVGYAQFLGDLANDHYRLECDIGLRNLYTVGAQSHGALTFRGNNQLGGSREYIKVVCVTDTVDTVTIYWQRILGNAAPEGGTLAVGLAISLAALRLCIEVEGADITVLRQPYGGGADVAVGDFTLSTPYNDAAHKRFGVDFLYVNTSGSGAGNLYDNYRVLGPNTPPPAPARVLVR